MPVDEQVPSPPAAGAPQDAPLAASPAEAAPAAAAPGAPEPAPAPEPVAAAPEPAPAAPVEPAAPPAPEPTLLQQHDAAEAAKAKPAEAAPAAPAAAAPVDPKAPVSPPGTPAAADAKPIDPAAPAAEAAPLAPVEYKYELPETIRMDDALKGSFHGALDTFRSDPTNPQPLIDLHNQTMQQYADGLTQKQMDVWNETRKEWRTRTMADEQLGGSGFETTMGAVARMRDMFVPEARRAAFDEFLTTTGAGDHPEFLRILHNAARVFDEAPLPPPGARPPANIGQPPVRGMRGLYNRSTPRGQ